MIHNSIPYRKLKNHSRKWRSWYSSVLWGFFVSAASAEVVTDDMRAPVPGPIPAAVLRVIDGDTLEVRALIWIGQEVKTNVRLADVDTPELHGKCLEEKMLAERAKMHLMMLVSEGSVLLSAIAPDKFGRRVIARVETMQGVNLASDLIRNGLARPYRGGARQGWCYNPL